MADEDSKKQIQQILIVREVSQHSRGVAAVLSFVIPGMGQIYKGNLLHGILWLISVLIGYACFLVPGFILHLICLCDAAKKPINNSIEIVSNKGG